VTARAIGLFGGTFDPIHFGHLRPALELLEDLSLTEVRMVPCRLPPHRDRPTVTAADRLAMLERAVAGEPRLPIDHRELERPGPSYMVDTLASIRREEGDTPLCLLLGSDAFLGLDRWHRWEALAELAHIVVAHRPGWDLHGSLAGALRRLVDARRVAHAEALQERPAGALHFAPVTQLEISATGIRERIAQGRSIRYLLPEAVREYIDSRQLYR